MTINEAVKAAIDEWKSQNIQCEASMADHIRLLVEEAIMEYLPDADLEPEDDLEGTIVDVP